MFVKDERYLLFPKNKEISRLHKYLDEVKGDTKTLDKLDNDKDDNRGDKDATQKHQLQDNM